MADGRKNNGGRREGAGRPKKAVEEQQHHIFTEAIKRITGNDCPKDSKIDFVTQLAESDKGRIWIAEKVFGKPKDGLNAEEVGTAIGKAVLSFVNKDNA